MNNTCKFSNEWRRGYAGVFFILLAIFVFAHLIIFYRIVIQVPAILTGSKLITAEELIPLFDYRTQFIDQILNPYSDLTRGHEVRVGYSFLTSWVRHPKVLPFALIFMNALSACLLAMSMIVLLRITFKKSIKGVSIAIAACVAFVFHSILLYSKIIHFYTLVFGFGLFSFELALLTAGLYQGNVRRDRYVLYAAFLALINPSIHYHFLSWIAWPALAVSYIIFKFSAEGWKRVLQGALRAIVMLLVVATAPYFVYIRFLTWGVDSVGQLFPVFYNTIANGSLSLLQAISLISPGHVAMWNKGTYVPKGAWLETMLYVALSALFLLTGRKRRINASTGQSENSAVVIALWVLLLFSIWMSLGYRCSFSFHSVVAQFAKLLYDSHFPIARIALQWINTIMQVLRFPHRFHLLTFFTLASLISLESVWWLETRCSSRKKIGKQVWTGALLSILLMSPLVINSDLRTALWSGNFSGLLEPFAVSDELKHIRELLADVPEGSRLIVLPSVIGGLHVRDAVGNVHWLHDKFFIYYFNVPSILYSIGNPANIAQGFLLYIAFQAGGKRWVNVLRNNNIRYIVFVKDTVPRRHGPVYLKGIEGVIREALCNSEEILMLYEGSQYILFEVQPCSLEKETWALVSTDWGTYLNTVLASDSLFCRYDIYYSFNFDKAVEQHYERPGTVLPLETPKSQLDTKVLTSGKEALFLPDFNILPFSRFVGNLSGYPTMFSMFTLMDARSAWNIFKTVVPGPFDTLSGTATAIGSGSYVIVELNIKEARLYNLYLRGLFHDDLVLDVKKEGRRVRVQVRNISAYIGPIEYSYKRLGSFYLSPGRYIIRLENKGKAPLVIEGVVACTEEVPG